MPRKPFVLLLFVFLLPFALASQHTKRKPASASPIPVKSKEVSAARSNNLGVAYMEQQKIQLALDAFTDAATKNPAAFLPQLNRGIALLNLDKAAQAQPILEALSLREPKNPTVWFNLGLLYRNNNQPEKAVESFQKVVALVPTDPQAHYYLGDVYLNLQQYEKAAEAFQAALADDPRHVSAEFGLARAYQRLGRAEEARQHLQRFQYLTREKLGTPVSQIYGEQGQYSLVQRMNIEPEVPPAIRVSFVPAPANSFPSSISSPVRATSTAQNYLGSGVCVFDYDGDGRLDVLLANAGNGPALLHNLGGGRYEDVAKPAGLTGEPAIGCAAGDFDNDGVPDLALSFPGRIALYHNDKGLFRDVTKAAEITVEGSPLSLTFVDYDHDGDLDLYVTKISPFKVSGGELAFQPASAGNLLLRNNGNGTFTDVTQSTGLAASAPSLSATATDINNDRAVDLIVAKWQGSPSVYLNPREGVFSSHPLSDSPGEQHIVGSASFDFNKDGWMDIVTTQLTAPGIRLWKNLDGKRFESVALPKTNWKRAWGIACFDYDNDGWLDIAAIGEGEKGPELRIFRNRGSQGFEDVSASLGLEKIKLLLPRAVVAFDYDEDGATDLLITQVDGQPVLLRNQGGNANHSLRVRLKGLADNKTGLGTQVEVFAGDQHQKWQIAGSSGYLSQSPPEVNAGLGKEQKADVVRMLWPTGVVQDELEMAQGKPQTVDEIDRRGSSCPVLFAWNGNRYELITDVIGPAVIGHWVAPGETDTADPDEYIKVDGSRVKLRDGRLSFRVAEPMEEVNYLDQVRLLAIDHPAGTAAFPNERFVSNPPFPDFKVITSRGAHLPAGAWDGSGKNVMPALLKRDHTYVTGFDLLKFSGFAQPHTLELDLGEWDSSRPLRLLMYGFTEYFTANSMYSAYQAGIQVAAPYVEALSASGKWVRVIDDMGFPAGLPRTMVADLTGHLPPGTRRIRIITNLQIYWDQILIDNSAPDPAVRISEVPLASAGLHFHGYPKSEEKYFPGDLNYIYEKVSASGPYVRHIGEYTRYGDVLPLLKKADDHFAIFGSGEEVMIDFDPSQLSPVPEGWTRDYFFYANGFVKDMDFYESDALTVAPLPFHSMKNYPYAKGEHFPEDPESVEYQLDFNTRYQSGKGVSTYRYNFPSSTH